jgi:hypothetical protein
MLQEGIMAIQRIVEEDRIPPQGPNGHRRPLEIAINPTHNVRPQPTKLTVGQS